MLVVTLVVILFFICAVICAIVYVFIDNKKQAFMDEQIKKLQESYGKEILEQLDIVKSGNKVSYDRIQKTKFQLKDKTKEKVFNKVIIDFNKDKSNHEFTEIYMSKYRDYVKALISEKRSKEGDAYISFLLGEYKIDEEEINEFLIKCLNKNSLQLRYNAFMSICKIGNVSYFIEALNIMNNNNTNVNNKIIIDIIDEFGGNIEELNNLLMEYFCVLTEKSKCVIIEHLTSGNKKEFADILLRMLKNKKINKELKVSIIRYFSVIKYDKCSEILLEILDDECFECRALSAKALANYKSERVIDKLTNAIRDENYYVRLNSAVTLLQLDIDKDKINSILSSDDEYAKDIMNYAIYLETNSGGKEFYV